MGHGSSAAIPAPNHANHFPVFSIFFNQTFLRKLGLKRRPYCEFSRARTNNVCSRSVCSQKRLQPEIMPKIDALFESCYWSKKISNSFWVTPPGYTILYYTILYYTILYLLYYTIRYYTILYYTILYYTILYYTTLYYTIHW